MDQSEEEAEYNEKIRTDRPPPPLITHLAVMSYHTHPHQCSLTEQVHEEKWLVEQRRLKNNNCRGKNKKKPFLKHVDHKTRFIASFDMSSSGMEGRWWQWGGGTGTKKQQTCGRRDCRPTSGQTPVRFNHCLMVEDRDEAVNIHSFTKCFYSCQVRFIIRTS